MTGTCDRPTSCKNRLECFIPKICSLGDYINLNTNKEFDYMDLLCLMFGYWELDKENLFHNFLGSNDYSKHVNNYIAHDQRKNFLKFTRKIFKFDYFDYQDSKGYVEDKSYFYFKIIDKIENTTDTIKCILDCENTANNNDTEIGYENNVLLKFTILDFNLSRTIHYFYLGIRKVYGFNVLTFDGTTLSIDQIMDLQNIGIPIFKFDITSEKRNQSIFLISYMGGTDEISPESIIDIENAQKEADKKCIKQLNRINKLDLNCKCIDEKNNLNKTSCAERDDLSNDNIIMPKYCNYVGNIGNVFQKGLSICQNAASNTYKSEIQKLNPNNPDQYEKWLNSEKNDDSLMKVTLNIYNKNKDINNELMTKCPMMKLGLNGLINNDLRDTVIKDDLVNKVINKYIEKKDDLGLEINYDRDKDEEYNIKHNGEYYSNLHPLKECKYDSYKLLERICQDYSLPTDDDPISFVLPKKCNITDLKNLINECNIKNIPEVPGEDENDILERILPYTLELENEDNEEETTGKCNNIKMDTLGIDNTIDTWSRMWVEHNKNLNQIGNIVNETMTYESKYLDAKKKSISIYEDSLKNIDEINSKKNCALLGRTYTGIPNEPDDGTNCGKKLERGFKNLFIEKSLPVCMYNRNKTDKKEKTYMGYLKIGIFFLILFLIIYFVSKKFIK